MNQYLFLYPIKEYFESCIAYRAFLEDGHRPVKLCEMINARYRNNGYGINWLLFGKDEDDSKPDFSKVPSFVDIEPRDGILVAGVSFKKHTSEAVYADVDFILNQLPPHQRLVVGGFHQWDCVDKLARQSYERGVDTFVDEDTTELFFGSWAFRNCPLIRKEWTLDSLGLNDGNRALFEWIKNQRVSRPWFVHK